MELAIIYKDVGFSQKDIWGYSMIHIFLQKYNENLRTMLILINVTKKVLT